jgi:propanol-preferring alcohol dehydrogenase
MPADERVGEEVLPVRAMVLHTLGPIETAPLRLEELPVPEPGPGEVRVKVRYCGVCRTDLHIVEGELVPPRLPLVPGHQVVGIVDAVGGTRGAGEAGRQGRHSQTSLSGPGGRERSGVPAQPESLLGRRVGVPWLHGTCGKCDYCRSGMENLCDAIAFTGFSVDGGYEEYMIAAADYLVRLPDGFSDLEAAPLLCAGIIGYRSIKVAGIERGDTVGLFGFGASAHLAIQILRHMDCQVLVFTRGKQHQELALKLGASWAGRPEDGREGKCDRAITFAPSGAVIPQALRALRRGGTLAINAVHLEKVPEMDYGLIYWEKKIVTVANSTRQDADEFVRLAAKIPLDVSTEVYPLADANRALLDLKGGRIQGEAVLEVSRNGVERAGG